MLTVFGLPDYYDPVVTTAAARVEHWKAIDAGRRRWEVRMRRFLIPHLDADTRLLLRVAQQANTPGAAVARVEQALPQLETQWAERLGKLYAVVAGDFARRTHRGLERRFGGHKDSTPLSRMIEALMMGWATDELYLPVVTSWIREQGGQKIRQISQTSIKTIADALARGVAEGRSIPDLAREVQRVAPEINGRRAVVIARTEVIPASNLGARAGAFTSGLDLDHVWISTPGTRTRPAHAAASGQTRPMGEPFTVMGEKLLFPGDGSQGASAKNTIQCRCTVGYRERVE